MDYKAYFKGKKVTVLGLGLLGKQVGCAEFMARSGAQVTVTDLKTARELAPSVTRLKKYKNVRFVLGGHKLEDFENRDFILKPQGAHDDSPYLLHAKKHGIPIRMDDELFLSLAPENIKVIGVTGTRGKTTTATLLYEILKKAGKRAHLAGNIRGVATLDLLNKVKSGDIVILELSSWQLQGFHARKISPYVAIFTNFLDDHLNYYSSRKEYFADKAAIYKYQKRGDILILGENLSKKIKKVAAKRIVARAADVPKIWKVALLGEHNRENIASAVAAARVLKVPEKIIQKAVERFHGVRGRLELMRTLHGIKIYNDSSSGTPISTAAALRALAQEKGRIVLLVGGTDKNLDFKILLKEIPKYCKAVVLLPGTGTDKLVKNYELRVTSYKTKDLKEAVRKALSLAASGDTVLFSPGFLSFGMFVNVYDRNDQFVEIIRKLK